MKYLISNNKLFNRAKKTVREFFTNEDGLNTIEIIAIVILALTIVGLVTEFLTGANGDGGLISQLFRKIEELFNL